MDIFIIIDWYGRLLKVFLLNEIMDNFKFVELLKVVILLKGFIKKLLLVVLLDENDYRLYIKELSYDKMKCLVLFSLFFL